MSINYLFNELIEYSAKCNLIEDIDYIYVANRLIDLFKEESFEFEEVNSIRPINVILDEMCDYAYSKNIIDSNDVTTKDLFDTKIMGIVTPRPSEVLNKFNDLYKQDKKAATDYFYKLAINSNYVRMDRINKNICYKADSKYGMIDITINLSKPEKDPKMIAKMGSLKSTSYPKCALCYQNMGFAGDFNKAARVNHRLIPLTLNGSEYFLQYSPYVYFNEHSIVLNKLHKPMAIDHNCFTNLLEFLDIFPHYFIGSNADLPIVGGSILSHDHYQGGNYVFAMFNAKTVKDFGVIDNVNVSYINWPIDTLKLSSKSKEDLVKLADKVLETWRGYSNPEIKLYANTDNTPHNTITPIARKEGENYVLFMSLRNNFTDEEHPWGLYHPEERLHHIKKENIGLIEVMGLAVLPKRLIEEMDELKKVLLDNSKESLLDSELLSKHKEWYYEIKDKYSYTNENVDELIRKEIGLVFENVLECCGVFRFGNQVDEVSKFIDCVKRV